MANTVTNFRAIAGTKRVVQYVNIASDGTEETDLVIYDSSAVATVLGMTDSLHCKINNITYSTSSVLGVVKLEWDADTDVLAWSLPPYSGHGFYDFSRYGGLENQASTGITGDITLTSTGLAAGDSISLIIEVEPY